MFVCLCRVVTDTQVEEAIENGADSVSDVGDACDAGTGCGACHEQIQEMIDTARVCTRRRRASSTAPDLYQISASSGA